MLGLPHSAGYCDDMGPCLFHPFATPQRCFGQTFGNGQSSDPYGYELGTNPLQLYAADQAGIAPWSVEHALTPVSQAGYADECTCVRLTLPVAEHCPICRATQSKLSLNSQHMLCSTQHSLHHNSSLYALVLQDEHATEASLYTKALQIAALESLTNALDYGSITTATHTQLPYADNTPNKPLLESSCLPLSAAAPPTQHNSAYMHR